MTDFIKHLGSDEELAEIIRACARGELSEAEALRRAEAASGREGLGFACVDHGRNERCGMPEVVFAERKTPGQVAAICAAIHRRRGFVLATRAAREHAEAVRRELPEAVYDEPSRTLVAGEFPTPAAGTGLVVVAAAGTSDLPVAEEARITARALGCRTETLYDVGVAGLHRLLARLELLRSAEAIVAVAGMEGALPSVIGGLVACPVVAVPTSVGYGASFSGLAALLGMLNSCASGVSVVNIDNGFGGGAAAARIVLRPCRQTRGEA